MVAGSRELDLLPVPAVIVRGAQLVHANPAFYEAFGFARDEIEGGDMHALIDRHSLEDASYLHGQLRAEHRRRDVWFTFRSPRGDRTVGVRGAPWNGEDERVVLFMEEGVRGAAPAFFHALSRAAVELVRSGSEDDVLSHAAEALYSQGLNVYFYRLEGEEIVVAAVRAAPELVAEYERATGRPVLGSRVPGEYGVALRRVMSTGRASYEQDLDGLIAGLYPGEQAGRVRRTTGGRRGLQAPIWVGGQLYGAVGVVSDDLTPTGAGAVELFAQLVGRAIENVRLHRAAAERLEALERLQAEGVERERLAALGRAAQVMAHEVRNPLGVILNATTILGRAETLDAGLRRQTLGVLQEEVSRIDQIVRDLLDLGRPLAPERRPVDLALLARQAIERLEPRASGREVRFRIVHPGRTCRIEGDEELLTLAVRNLLRNAMQSSPDGGEVRISVVCGEDASGLAVEDDGAGIPENVRRHVFEPFFTTRATGAGLGLAFVKRIADVHEAQVRLGDVPSGTRFELLFPARATTCE